MKILTTFFSFFMALSAAAQFAIDGVVTDFQDGTPLAGASITLQNSSRGAVALRKGQFRISNLQAGTYTLKVSFVGFESVSQSLDLQSNTTLEIPLKRSVFMADEVVVSATRATDNMGLAYSNVAMSDIQKQNLGQDLPVLLNLQPSVVSTSDAGAGIGYTGIRIRGSDASRVNVTLNGIPYNDAESQGTFWVNMPDFASSVSSIQIQRGVGTSTNGAGAFGATVNVQTNDFRPDAYAEVNNTFGSYNTWRHTLKAGSGLLRGKFTVDARLSKISSDGYVERASSALNALHLSGAYFGKKSFFRFNAFLGKEKTYQAWAGVPENLLVTNRRYNYYTYANQTDNYWQDQYQLLSSHELSKNWTLNVNLFYTKGKGYYEEFQNQSFLGDYGLKPIKEGNEVDLIRQKWLDNDFYGTTFSLDYNSFKNLKLNFGGGYNEYKGRHFGDIIWTQYATTTLPYRWYNGHASKSDFNLYAKATYALTERLNAFIDLQTRNVGYNIAGIDNKRRDITTEDNLHFFNPKVGLNYRVSESSTAYASYSVANREPSRSDYVDNPFYSSPTQKVQPKPETLHDIEIGYKTQAKNWTLGINAYLMNYQNQLVLTGQLNDVGNPIRQNVARSFRHGIELDLATQLSKTLRWTANATFSRNKIKDFTEAIPNYDTGIDLMKDYQETDISFSPNVIAGSQWVYVPHKNWELAWLSKYVGKQFLDNTSNPNSQLSAYFTNDLRIGYSHKGKTLKDLTISLLANNIFGVLYESNGYNYSYVYEGKTITENFYYPQAPQNFLLAVGLKF